MTSNDAKNSLITSFVSCRRSEVLLITISENLEMYMSPSIQYFW